MKRLLICSAILALLGAAWPAAAQPGACRQQAFRGVWCATCTGFTSLANIDPAADPKTLVPFSMLVRTEINAQGEGAGSGHASVGGVVLPFDTKAVFTMKPDCTGEKTYTLTVPALGAVLPGKAVVIYSSSGDEFRILLTNPGDAISCVYKKIYMQGM